MQLKFAVENALVGDKLKSDRASNFFCTVTDFCSLIKFYKAETTDDDE